MYRLLDSRANTLLTVSTLALVSYSEYMPDMWPEKNVPDFRMALCNRVGEMNQQKSMYVMSKHLRICLNFHLKCFHISRDTSEIVLHVIKQCLQAVRHLCCWLYAGYTRTSQ